METNHYYGDDCPGGHLEHVDLIDPIDTHDELLSPKFRFPKQKTEYDPPKYIDGVTSTAVESIEKLRGKGEIHYRANVEESFDPDPSDVDGRWPYNA